MSRSTQSSAAAAETPAAGTDAPLAYLELKSIGLPQSITPSASRALCDLVAGETGVPANRIYIEFSDAPRQMWGWNGDTF